MTIQWGIKSCLWFAYLAGLIVGMAMREWELKYFIIGFIILAIASMLCGHFLRQIVTRYDFWDEWRGNDGEVTMQIKRLIRLFGYRADLHRIVAADKRGCFHTHPATAYRLILWGGYTEELRDGKLKIWKPGMFGRIDPALNHRIYYITNGKSSYSLWFRGRVTDPIHTDGC